jgi:dCMP deaminase
MLAALLAAQRSPDPSTQVGAVIVNKKNRRLASGYNSYPNGVGTHHFSWARKHDDPLQTKYPYVVHAEKNSIYNAVGNVEGCTLYVTMFPCNECAKDIIQAGITKLVWLTDPYRDGWQAKAAAAMFDHLDIETKQHVWEDKEAVLECLSNLSNLISSSP